MIENAAPFESSLRPSGFSQHDQKALAIAKDMDAQENSGQIDFDARAEELTNAFYMQTGILNMHRNRYREQQALGNTDKLAESAIRAASEAIEKIKQQRRELETLRRNQPQPIPQATSQQTLVSPTQPQATQIPFPNTFPPQNPAYPLPPPYMPQQVPIDHSQRIAQLENRILVLETKISLLERMLTNPSAPQQKRKKQPTVNIDAQNQNENA